MGGRKDLCGARLGTSFEARRWLSLDPCGFLGISMSFSAHAFAFTVIAWHLIAGSLVATAVFVLLYVPSVVLAITSLFMAWTTDPGAVPLGARPLVTVKRAASGELMATQGQRNRALRRCHKCNDNFKPNRAHHDSVTGRCIVKFDHFCPWIGNAVGAMNHKFFVLFVGYTMVSCLFSLCLIGLRTWHCGFPVPYDTRDKKYAQECTGWNESYSSLILLIISVVFFLFTACMLYENLEAIETNASKIARMKMRVGQAGTELSRVTEEFNEMFGGESNEVAWHWFFPLSVEFPRGMQKVVLGFEWDETFDAVPYEESHGNGDVELGTTNTTIGDPSALSSSLPPSNKEKNSEHENPDDPAIVPGGRSQVLSSVPPTASKGGSSSLVKRGNSRDRPANNKDQPVQGTFT
ncbi:DHHC palmitoyltransferase [Nitzschia inconspicua]|uniref:Palmitoyltransferase n=1 Tax=Nitzschia inconspicua TaxID=303405 RepID=A0A9K3K8H0_9STRA|nr:DHHC palmitoyltransferase [Nitzschia inconspicua]KAG7362143.1 DHHC palmitoyltransferase [Nitzschia inconspicua]